MATYLQLINRTLIALCHGDDLVDAAAATLTDRNHIKIAQFVNDIMEQVEDAAQWRVLRTRDTATILASAISATLASSNERSRVWRVHDAAYEMLVPLVFDVTNTSQQKRLWELDPAEIHRRDQENSNQAQGTSPTHFALEPTATGMTILLWPRVTAAVNIEIDMIIPQGRLPATTNAEIIVAVKVPGLAIQLGTIWWALEDRGEELGPNGQLAGRRYSDELAQSVALEHSAQGLDTLVPV